MRGSRAALLSLTVLAVHLLGAGQAVADSNQTEQRPVMLCNIVVLSPGAQTGDGCTAVQVSGQSIVKEDSVTSALIDFVGIRPALL
ncbi:hypothetical protein [Streptomyces aidingensis]|uniref:Uncharacterized protein n=1 Tax=Streptomyces aidingensis TaxID=910347 RepID=A0A1I1N6B8_9ACTN|nr:hypothetical protein [Streptomyces aidingensis]SFC93221.1 hypothetical protein SAMN05421773_107251 [Streptomyces aidingensis]